MEQTYPEPVCGALIFNKGKMLLVRSHKWNNKFLIPGGHIELGERMIDTVKREILEETGLEVKNIEFLMFHEFIFGKEFHKKKHFIMFDFTCTSDSSVVKLDDEGQEYIWATPKDALRLPLEKFTRKTILTYIGRD